MLDTFVFKQGNISISSKRIFHPISLLYITYDGFLQLLRLCADTSSKNEKETKTENTGITL